MKKLADPEAYFYGFVTATFMLAEWREGKMFIRNKPIREYLMEQSRRWKIPRDTAVNVISAALGE